VRVAVNTYRTRAGADAAIELAYDVFGQRGLPLVAIMGIGAQRIFWDEPMCEALVAAGFVVVRFDARDVGESTHLDAEVPRQPPRMLEQITKYLSVSNPLPGPIMLSHQPAAPVILSVPAACASPVKAWRIKMALFLRAFNSPYVSYATSTGASVVPQSSAIESNWMTCVSVIIRSCKSMR